MGICHFWDWVSLTHLIDQTTVLNGKLSRCSLKCVLPWGETESPYPCRIQLTHTCTGFLFEHCLTSRLVVHTCGLKQRKFLLGDWYWNPRLSLSLSLSCCSTSTPTCRSRTCAQTIEESVRVKLDYGGTAMPWQRSALSECCEFVIKHRRLVWNMVFVSQNNSNMTGIIQTTPNVSRKDTGFQLNYLGVLHLGWND